MSVGDLAGHLMVSRQSLSGLTGRMERGGHVTVELDGRDRRSRIVRMTPSGRHVWEVLARPKILDYYDAVLADLSISDVTHTLHYLLKMLENMERVDAAQLGVDSEAGEAQAADAAPRA